MLINFLVLMLQCTVRCLCFSIFANENRKNKNHPLLYLLYDCIVCFFQVYVLRTKMCFRVIKKLSIVLGYCTVRKCTCLVFNTYMALFTYTHNAMEWNPLYCTDVHFASFLSGGFTTVAVINPPERKLAKRTSVQCMYFLNCGNVI